MKNKLDLQIIKQASAVLKRLSHPDRLRIVERLEAGEASVSDLMSDLRLGQVAVSKHLMVLKQGGIVECRIKGNYRLYSIAHHNVLNILDCIRKHGRKSK